MFKILLLGLGAAVVLAGLHIANGLKRNIAAAKKSGLPYVISPFFAWSTPWQVVHKALMPVIKLLPKPWWENWLPSVIADSGWIHQHQLYAKHGDSYLIVSPSQIQLTTASAEMIRQITTRREDFPKATGIYGLLAQFGHNVLTTEGHVWRMHRKITSASFNERNAALVFRESIRQTIGMLTFWKEEHGDGGTNRNLDRDTMRWALNIIGYAGFGLRLPWPNEKPDVNVDPISARYSSITPPPGYSFSFVEAMAILMEKVLLCLLVPAWLLRIFPSESLNKAYEARRDYLNYIDELLDSKIKDAQSGTANVTEGMDIMGQLVRSSYASEVEGGAKSANAAKLARDEITGNAFVMLVAGHETTANTINFTMLHLACRPASQRRLQRELDELLGSSDPATWDYEELVNPLMGGMVGACLNETLRMTTSVLEIPKLVSPSQDQVVTVDGEKYLLPRSTYISLSAVSVQKNPRYWPTQPSRLYPGKDDMDEFVPERWFLTAKNSGVASSGADDEEKAAGDDGEDYGGYKGRDTSAHLFRPERGAYIPFSDGPRSCLGRRIALVELAAALAVIFREYSVELAVDEWAGDEEVAAMDREQMRAVYDQARRKKDKAVEGASSLLTLKVRDEVIPIRLVKRGKERFVGWMDEDME